MPRLQSHASPQRPPGRPLMRMQWRHLLFMHWRVPASVLRPHVSSDVEIDEFDGSAWIGLIPFTMRHVLPAIVPAMAGVGDLPGISAFHECNVRTYVIPRRGEPIPGVWFFSLDAASRPAVWAARRFFHLPYFRAKMTLDRRADTVRYSVDRVDPPRAAMRCEWQVGKSLAPSTRGELAYFLTERYALYTTDPAGALRRCRIWHEPWPLRAAELISLDDHLVQSAGVVVDQSPSPVLHHVDTLNVRAWKLDGV